ncbi:MAG: hypothetical protein IT425_05515 [Pirellulales bacterium]|nr:hypothetical protein [Pirellulales bacterium]
MVRLLKPDRTRPRNYLSRREQWRLWLMFLPLVMVIVAIRWLRDPAHAARVDQALALVTAEENTPAASGESPPAVKAAPTNTAAPPAPNRESPKLFPGVEPAWLETIVDNSYFRKSETAAWFGMFGALLKADDPTLQRASRISVGYAQLLNQPHAYRGKLVEVAGTVRQITRQTPAANELGISIYYRLVLQPADQSNWPIFVYCLQLPTEVSLGQDSYSLNARVTGLFFKNLSYDWEKGLGTAPVIVAKSFALDANSAASVNPPATVPLPPNPPRESASPGPGPPTDRSPAPSPSPSASLSGVAALESKTPDSSLGAALLDELGMDRKLLKKVTNRGPLRQDDHDAFYELLKAAGQIGANQLARAAQRNIPAARDEWIARRDSATSDRERNLASQSLRALQQGRYDVAPLFNDTANQQGRLFVFDGIAKRVVRIEAGTTAKGLPSDSLQRFGFDHYYELDVFTDDSQNHPLVFCVRELPPDFPTGETVRLPVRMAGFFLKAWLYRAREIEEDVVADEPHSPPSNRLPGDVDPAKYSPLLIGRAPIVLLIEPANSPFVQYIGGAAFVALLVGIWLAVAAYNRGDRRFRLRLPVTLVSLPEGQSLNDLKIPSENSPHSASVALPNAADDS